MPIIEASGLTKKYPRPDRGSEYFDAVSGISLNINEGEIHAILGPNGAGKTTTLEMLEGLTDIDAGWARVDGISVSEHPYRVKAIIGVQLQANEFFDHLSLREILAMFGFLYGRKVNPENLLETVNLAEHAKAKPDSLSGGQKQRLSVACALVNDPRIVFLDEPTTGLDPQAKRRMWNLVRELNAAGTTIVLTTHNMEEAETLCHQLTIMDHGKVIAEGSPNDLILMYAPEPPARPAHGNLEDVFLALTGHGLRD